LARVGPNAEQVIFCGRFTNYVTTDVLLLNKAKMSGTCYMECVAEQALIS